MPAPHIKPGVPETTAAPAAGTGRTSLALVSALPAVAAGLVEGGLLHAFANGHLGWKLLLAAHLTVILLLGAWAHWAGRKLGDSAMPLLVTVAVAAAGPFGALAGIATAMLTLSHADDPGLLKDWYERIALAVATDDDTRLCEQVMSGRTADLTGRPPLSFAAVMDRGSLDERQAALGLIARNFHPDYLPVLMMALKSAEPVIRVQAAAVATRVRGDLRAMVDRHALDSETIATGDSRALTAAAHLDTAIASGLLDEGDRIRASVVAARLRVRPTAGPRQASLAAIPILERATTETTLLREGRYGELRLARRLAAIADAGGYRVRRARRAASAEAP